jgi:hypothetical protein
MQHRIPFWMAAAALSLFFSAAPAASSAQSRESCSELIQRAQTYQQDIKTVNIVLSSAIDAGNIDRIKTYKLKRSALKKELESVLKAIQSNDCASPQ